MLWAEGFFHFFVFVVAISWNKWGAIVFCGHQTVIIFLIWGGGGCHDSQLLGKESILEIKHMDSGIRMPVLISCSTTSWMWDFENSNTPWLLFSHL